MRKIISAAQFTLADQDCIATENITSIELMNRAARAFLGIFNGLVPSTNTPIVILCGTGNNGGDGLVIARLLESTGYEHIAVVVIPTGKQPTPEFLFNLKRLETTDVSVRHLGEVSLRDFESLDIDFSESVVIDALLGTGISRPLSGGLRDIVNKLNQLCKNVVAVDIPTGFRCEGEFTDDDVVLKARDVITFQLPKLNFLFPESARFMDHFHVVDIGLREEFVAQLPSSFHCIESADIEKIYRQRSAFSHKGNYGHALIYAGSSDKVGAALICAEASIYSGAGLTTVCLPQEERHALYARLPEAMFVSGSVTAKSKHYSAVAFGPGLADRSSSFPPLIKSLEVPFVIDADGLNYLAENKTLLHSLPAETVLTPHMKEFDRLFGTSDNWWQRVQLAIQKAKELDVIIVLKNRYTFIVINTGEVFISPTGNPAMATGGMGDALTGMIVSFLAQGYSPREACMLGCFLHGRAGDRLHLNGHAVVLPTALIKEIPLLLGELR